MSEENWYKSVTHATSLAQGDIFFNCPIIKPTYESFDSSGNLELEGTIDEYNVVVLSQSCDLENDKLKIALVSPIFTLKRFSEFDPTFASKGKREKLRQGDFPPYHLLDNPKKKTLPDDYFVVDFHSVFGVPMVQLKDMLVKKKRKLTLKSPYKEHLSQSFARYLMRVGLPSTIPPFK